MFDNPSPLASHEISSKSSEKNIPDDAIAFESYLGSQISKLQDGFELYPA